MIRTMFSFGRLLLLVGALPLLTPSASQAQPYTGGYRIGVSYGPSSSGYHRYNAYRAPFGYRYSTYPRGVYRNYGYYPYNTGYGYYPYAGTYGYYSNLGTSSSPASSTRYGGFEESEFVDPVPPTPPPTPADATRAYLRVAVPAGAEVWFDNWKTAATGPVREFRTPPLETGSQYSYLVRARWFDGSQWVTQSQQVPLVAGDEIDVVFPRPGTTLTP